MRMLAFAVFALSISALAIAACSDDKETPPTSAQTEDAGATSSSSSGEAGSSGNAGTSCSAVAQAGASVDIFIAKPPAPTPTGGTPPDGTYILKSAKAFTDIFPEGNRLQTFGAYTLVIGGGATTFEQAVTNKNEELKRAKGKLLAEGTKFTATPDCEDPGLEDGGVTVLQGNFSSEGNVLKMYVVRELNTTAELLFEKQ